MQWTLLRDNFYMDVMLQFVGEGGVLRGPAGDGRCSLVARDDVAAVATKVLMAPEDHAGKTYDLTGPEALTLSEVAEAISSAQGRTVTFHNETVEEAYESRRAWPAEQWEYDAWVSTYTAIASGDLSQISGGRGKSYRPPAHDLRAVPPRNGMTRSPSDAHWTGPSS